MKTEKISDAYKNAKPFNEIEREKIARKIADEITLRERPNDTIIDLPDGNRAIIEKEKAPLYQKNLFETYCNEFKKKIVGEEESYQVIFLCACGRLVENSQVASYNLLVNSESGAGKDYLVSKVLELLPDEHYIKKTRISPTAFTYWHNSAFEPDWSWYGKVFYCEDISEGVLNSDVFKVMTSSGSSATITIKQRATEIIINGKPVIITTTASANPNPEGIRRNVLLQLDESVNQTREIKKRWAEFKKKGINPEYNQDLINAQKYLKRVKVKIPFADLLPDYFPDNNIIMRTNFPRFLDFISASASFHQYQREKDNEDFILATGEDYNIARKCFLKLFSNKYMIPLTRNQKQILSFFEKSLYLSGSVSQLYNMSGINFISNRALETNLKILVKYGILTTSIEQDSLNRDIVSYQLNRAYSINEKLNLPTFEEICRNTSISSIPTITSISSITSITNRDSEVIEDSEAENRIQNSHKTIKISSQEPEETKNG